MTKQTKRNKAIRTEYYPDGVNKKSEIFFFEESNTYLTVEYLRPEFNINGKQFRYFEILSHPDNIWIKKTTFAYEVKYTECFYESFYSGKKNVLQKENVYEKDGKTIKYTVYYKDGKNGRVPSRTVYPGNN